MARQLERKGHKVGLVAMIGPPAWNPTHWRWVKDCVAAVASLRGSGPERATDLFLALRERRMRARQFCEYALTWLQEIADGSRSDRMAMAARLARRFVSGALVSEQPWAGEPVQPPATDDDLMTVYRRAVASYVRRRYSGRVTMLWPREVPVNTLGGAPLTWVSAPDPSLGWRKVAAAIEVHELPGDYTTSITRHVQILANRMKASVQEARSHHGGDTSGRVRRAVDLRLLDRLFAPTRVR
jgi:hypothetical protein